MNEKYEYALLEKHNHVLFGLLHDIKTPLSGVLGLAQSLYDAESNEQKKEKLSNITKSVTALSCFLSELFESMDSANEQVTLLNLDMLLASCIHLLKPSADIKNLKLSYHFSGSKYVLSHAVYLQKIIINLLENAIHFTDSGSVSVICTVNEKIELKVIDSGVGIAKAHQEKIYNRSFKVPDALKNNSAYCGKGFGLYAVKQMVEALEGSVFVESDLGKGATFYVTVPLFKSRQDNAVELEMDLACHRLSDSSEDIINVLLVEDSKISQLVQVEILKKAGFTVDVVDNGMDAIKRFKRTDYDVILLDMQLPDNHARDIANEIRFIEKAKNDKKTVIVMITAYLPKEGYAEDAEHVQLILEKPITPVHINLIKKSLLSSKFDL